MDSTQTSITVSFKSADILPPLFVAGSFSHPPWTPQEMEHTATASGLHIFTKTIHGEPGSTIQYKFCTAAGQQWFLDESAPSTADEMGNMNNIVQVIDHSSTGLGSPPTPPPDSPLHSPLLPPLAMGLGKAEIGPLFSHECLAPPSHDAANGDRYFDDDSRESPRGPPMFAYELADGSHRRPSQSGRERASSHGSHGHRSLGSVGSLGSNPYQDDEQQFDPNDPTLERFPSSRDEVLERVRTIETGLEEDRASFDGIPLSPVVSPSSRRHSVDLHLHATDPFTMPPAAAAAAAEPPLSPTSGRMAPAERPQRSSRGSRDFSGRSVSGSSLHCISEEEAASAEEGEPRRQLLPSQAAGVGSGSQEPSTSSLDADHGRASEPEDTSPRTRAADEETETEQAITQKSTVNTSLTLPISLWRRMFGCIHWVSGLCKLLIVDWVGAFFQRRGRRS